MGQEWMALGGGPNHVANDEGKQVGEPSTHSLSECKSACENNADCNSFAYCGNSCYLKDKSIEADAPEHYNAACSTYYRPSERTCYQVFSDMAYNSLLQYFPSNPDSHMMGYAQCTACTDGAIWCDAQVTNGLTPLIASHIHLAEDGDGEHGSGEPVISFCGDNSPGMITDAGPYQEPCAPWMDSRSQNKNMRPFFIEGTNHGMTMAERVNDLIRYPSKYYFNFHSKASWLHWSMQDPPTPKGTCRGVMKASPYAADVVERASPHGGADVLEIKLTSPGASDVSGSQEWMALGGGPNHVANDEGKQVGELSTHSLSECKSACENNADCNSFAYCGNSCYLKDKSIEADAPEHYNQACSTYYRPSERTCYQVFSDMGYNSLLQYFPSNPDSHMMGYAQCTACT